MMNYDKFKKRKPLDVIDAEWRPVREPLKKWDLLTGIALAIMFFSGAAVCFWSSGVLDWWELKRFGQETPASVVDIDFTSSILAGESFSSNLLTVQFRDDRHQLHTVKITDPGRFAFDSGLDPHNPYASVRKKTEIVYSRRDPTIAELRDYRNHSWCMFTFSFVVAGMYPLFCFLARREARRRV